MPPIIPPRGLQINERWEQKAALKGKTLQALSEQLESGEKPSLTAAGQRALERRAARARAARASFSLLSPVLPCHVCLLPFSFEGTTAHLGVR